MMQQAERLADAQDQAVFLEQVKVNQEINARMQACAR